MFRHYRWLVGLWLLSFVCVFAAHAEEQIGATPAQMLIVAGFEEPLVADGPATPAEERELSKAIDAFSRLKSPRDFPDLAAPFEAYLAARPNSPWRMAIRVNLGIGYYHSGYFTKALNAWQQAWDIGRSSTELQAKALADRAFGELVRMHARVGHATDLRRLFTELGDRAVSGPATELVTGAREGLWMFENDPGTSYLCGPTALRNLLLAQGGDDAGLKRLSEARSGSRGFSLAQLSTLAADVGLQHKLIHRTTAAPIPVPSIVNWKLNHYAAIVGEQAGRYRIQDPTFGGGDMWLTKAAINAESSGYFLVPLNAGAHGQWRAATDKESQRVFGMGQTTVNQMGAVTPDDKRLNDSSCSRGMCVANAHLMQVSLNLNDTPVGYQPPRGPAVKVRLTYNQREVGQPANFGFFNVSPKWTLNFLSYIQDSPSAPGQAVTRYVAGGGTVDYSIGYQYGTSTGAFSPERQSQAVLVRVPATGPVTAYELRLADGSKQIFEKSDGSTIAPRRMFMTRVVDKVGNALALTYDGQMRLTSIGDASGRNTILRYQNPSNALLVTSIADPFGRQANITYDTNGRLASITDVIGLTSAFAYDANSLINSMTTPYGTTRFQFGQNTNVNLRFLDITDPLGLTERIEFRHFAPGIRTQELVAPNVGEQNVFLEFRNTFHWDKHVYPITHTDHTRARLTHWLHNVAGQTSPVIESIKEPLENRVWNLYQGQDILGVTYFEGTLGKPLAAARVLDDNSTQLSISVRNELGKPTIVADSLGRVTVSTYADNKIDPVKVEQLISMPNEPDRFSTLATVTYDDRHLPRTSTDAAGNTTQYTYNSAGQVMSVTNALGQTTRYGYDDIGRLMSITNANGAVDQTVTYDAFDRVASVTDSEGYRLAYEYDAFDRLTKIAYPDNTTTEYTYDRLDLVAVKDRLNRVIRSAYDANRRLTSVTDAKGQITRYDYYGNGVLKSITDPKGSVTSWDIDIQGRVTAKRFADGTRRVFAYESTTSRLKSVTDALGQVKTFEYFNDDQVKSIKYANARNPTAPVTFAYDRVFPRAVSMTDGVGTTTFQYRPVGSAGALELAQEDGPYANDTVAYEYDALNRLVKRTIDSVPEVLAYDALGRPTVHDSTLGKFSTMYLGETDQMMSVVSANGLVGTQLEYEGNLADRRLRSVRNGSAARMFGYTTSPENRIASVTELVNGKQQQRFDYGYDEVDQLLGATPFTGVQHSYIYDSAGSPTTIANAAGIRDTSFNSLNQIVASNGVAFAYDANGNLLDDGVRTYRWDAEDRLVGVAYKASPQQSTAFRYDGRGNRLAIVNTIGTSINETRYLWCGDTICQARTSADVVSRRYYAEGEVIPQGNTQLYYATDHLGSVRDVLAVQNGSRVASYDYDPYGNPLAQAGRISADMRYAGMFYHPQSGLYLTKFRAYDPRTARWLSRDPIEEAGGPNIYSYVSGNVINKIDPTGEIGIVGAIIGGATNALLQVSFQLYRNGGDVFAAVGCVNLTAVAVAAAAGAVLPGLGDVGASAFGVVVSGSETVLSFGAKSILFGFVGLPYKTLLDASLPEIRFSDDCNCVNNGMSSGEGFF